MQLQKTINPDITSIFNNGEYIGEIVNRDTFFEAIHRNGLKACFTSFDACKQLFEEVIKPNTIKRNNQLNLF